jgi:hypothetical protein
MRAAIPATRAQEISNALRVSPPHDLRPMQRVARGPRLSWQHHHPGVEPEETSGHRADFAVGDDTQHHGASGGALPRYNHLLTRCADDLILVQELVDDSATVTSDDDRRVGMCRKKTSPREEADQFLHCLSHLVRSFRRTLMRGFWRSEGEEVSPAWFKCVAPPQEAAAVDDPHSVRWM